MSITLWPAHLKPKEDELLSSWLVRLAMANGQKLHTFCEIIWPGTQVWTRDIDKCASPEMLLTLSERTGAPDWRVWRTTLAAYEGVLYQRHNRFGPSPWIMPVGVYHRTRTRFGLQFCPRCLAEDKTPYYRRRWRLAFMVVCESHEILLHDRCPHCGATVSFHRGEMGKVEKLSPPGLTECNVCSSDFRDFTEYSALPSPAEVVLARFLIRVMDEGSASLSSDVKTYSHMYFSVLRQLMTVLSSNQKGVDNLRVALCRRYSAERYEAPAHSRPDIQEMDVTERRGLLAMARLLLEDWPDRFVGLSLEFRLWSSLWLRHFGRGDREGTAEAPYWFWSVVHAHLYRAKYQPTKEELRRAAGYLRKKGQVNRLRLARLLGLAVVRNHQIRRATRKQGDKRVRGAVNLKPRRTQTQVRVCRKKQG